jgi:hypothetical protein
MRAVVIALVLAALAAALPAEAARVLRGEQGTMDLASSSSQDESLQPRPVTVTSESILAAAGTHRKQTEDAVAVRMYEAILHTRAGNCNHLQIHGRGWRLHLHQPASGSDWRCIGSIPWGSQPDEENPGDGSVHNCWKTDARWKHISGGADVTITERTTATEGITESTARSVTNSIALEMGFQGGPSFARATMSLTGTRTTSRTVTDTVSNTWGVERGIQHSISCQHGQVFQWVTQISTPYLGGKDVSVATAHFACVPNDKVGPGGNPAEPMCPPRFCNDHACQCCNSASWTVERSKANVCRAPQRFPF